jgi:heme/copper-type cytochrome/quinol oxidase subunit 2
MWIVWGLLAVITTALVLYRASLNRNEEDQIFLDASFDHEKSEQEEIVARINKIEPLVRLSFWLISAATLFVLVYYSWNIIAQFK